MKAFFYAVALLACAGFAANNPAVAAPNASTPPLATGGEQHSVQVQCTDGSVDNIHPVTPAAG